MTRPMRRPSPLLSLAVLLSAGMFANAEPQPISLYDRNPQHLWNRLHAALTTCAPDGQTLPPDVLDPPYLELLFEGALNRNVVALLEEFVKGPPAPGTMSPLQRAVMQRDLLAVFHRLPLRSNPGERELALALARAIRGVALTADEVRKLPDNYAAATGLAETPTEYDAAHPGPFLPKGLLADDGPWIALEERRRGTMVAAFHFKTFHGRASFEVRMRHPDGREAGEAYLKSLAEMPQPWVYEKPAPSANLRPNSPDIATWPNPATPQFPTGTMWALVRRAVLADTNGRPAVSPLVESVQIRVYRALSMQDAMKSPEYVQKSKDLEAGQRDGEIADLVAETYQTSFEWEMQRSMLYGKGGFHLTQPEDLKFSAFAPDEPRPIAGFCLQCHSPPGIHSVQSRAGLFNEPLARPPEFQPSNRERLDRVTWHEAHEQPGWVLLQWLWMDPPQP